MGGPAHAPPIGLTCAVKGPRHPPVRECARGPVDDGARLSLALEVRECARGPVAGRVGQWLGAWVLLLVVVTPSCAAGPYWWQCGRPAWTTTCGVNLRMKGPRYPPVRQILPSLWPMPPSLWAMAPPRVDRTRAHHTYPPHQGLTPATQQDLSPSHAPRRDSSAARCPPPVATRSAVSRPTGRWAASAARKSPAHPQCRRRNAPRAHRARNR